MIGYIEGKLLQVEEDRILVLANQIGYEILVPVFVLAKMQKAAPGEEVRLFIYHVEAETLESIHDHNAYAKLSRGRDPSGTSDWR